MANPNRSTRSDVALKVCADQQFGEVSRYCFYQLVELIHHLSEVNPDGSLALSPAQEPIRFKSYAGLGFPASDVLSITRTANGGYQLETSFLGLHGSQSPLPGYYLDPIAWEDAQHQQGLKDFLDLFNHRLLTMLYHVWRKYRYYICYDSDGKDPFSAKVFSLVGLGNDAVRRSLPVNHSKMLAYVGLLASPGRSPEVICSLISHCFDLPEVSLQTWQWRKVPITPDQQNRLGTQTLMRSKRFRKQSVLGKNFSLGANVADRRGKFLLCINKLSIKRLLSFLPNGEHYLPLITFVSFILRDQLAWDLRLDLAQQQAGGMTLGQELHSQLGWTTFLGQPDVEPYVTLCIRE